MVVVTVCGFWFTAKYIEAESAGLSTATYVRAGSELSEKTINVLIAENIIEPGDTVQYFYSYGVFSLLDGGSLLTDREVIIYYPGENKETEVYLYDLKDVRTIKKMNEGGFLTDEVYRISGDDPDSWIQIELSVEDKKHLDFVDALYASAVNLVQE